jgi:hypothetical protein
LPDQPDRGHPLINQPGILPGADKIGIVDAARKHKIVQRSSTTFQPCQNTGAGELKELKLDWSAGLLLDNAGSRTNLTATHKIADFGDVAVSQLTVDREIEHRPVACSVLNTQPEPNCPHLLKFQCPLRAHYPAGIPRPPIFDAQLII